MNPPPSRVLCTINKHDCTQLPSGKAPSVKPLTNPAPSERDIHDRIFTAILDRRLPPGARLGEVPLAELFGVSRTKIRQALARLQQDGVVEQRPNQGARVAIPSVAQTRHVFELRAMLEPALAAHVAQSHRPADIRRLRAHIALERAAQRDRDDAALIRLTGLFHLLIAELHANPMILRTLRDLEALTCLAILHYAPAAAGACLLHEHAAIVRALAARDGASAASLMRQHLDHVATELSLEPAPAKAWRLSDALAPLSQPRTIHA